MTTERSFPIASLPLPPENWSAWTADTLAEAREREAPLLLLVVEGWSERSRAVIEALNADGPFDAWLRESGPGIVVDADERPDIAERYVTGDLPHASFITPDGDPMATVDQVNPVRIRATGEAIREAWMHRREQLLHEIEFARAMRAAERATASARRSPGVLTPAMLETGLEVIEAADQSTLDASQVASAIRLWRYAHLRRSTPDALEQARAAMRALVGGELVEEAVDDEDVRLGAIPHAADEPALALRDQASVLLALADLGTVHAESRIDAHPRASCIARFVIDVLGEPYGGFSQAASSLDPASADPRVFTASTARAARALLVAGGIFGEREWVERGRRAVDFLLERLRAGEAGFYHRWDGAPAGFGYLGDQAETLLAMLQAYEVSGAANYLEHARRLVRILERDWREPGRGFRDLSELSDSEVAEQGGLLVEPRLPLDENVMMAEALLWLARLTHDEHLLDIAVETLAMFGNGLEQYGVGVAVYVRTVDRLLSAEPEIKVIAEQPPGEPDRIADPLMLEALRLPVAGRTVQRLTQGIDDDLLQQLGLPLGGGRGAYVCIGSTCSPPVTQPEQLLAAAEEMIESPV